jgi:Flp pilus assembly protein TadG
MRQIPGQSNRRIPRSQHPLLAGLMRFACDQRGGVAPLLAIAAVPLLVGTGAAVDFGRAQSAKAVMQAAVDATALAIVRAKAENTAVPDATSFFNAAFSLSGVQTITVKSNVTSSNGGYTASLTAQGQLPTSFMGVIGYSQLTIGVNASAYSSNNQAGCVMALNKTAASAISLGGSTTVNLSNCSLFSNSSSDTAVSVGGSASLTALSIGAVGGVSAGTSNVTLTHGIQAHIGAISNPYADVTVPTFSGCTDTNVRVKSATTLSPGVYCNGISVNAGGALTLNPGIYYIDRGNFSVNGGGTVTGTGVTLIFTSSTGMNYATATINGNASINLTAPSSGSTAGIVIFGDPNAPVGTAINLSGGSTQAFGGAIYAPTGAITYTGGASTSSSCTQIIGDTVTFTGNSSVAINCSSYKTRPFGPVMSTLIS